MALLASWHKLSIGSVFLILRLFKDIILTDLTKNTQTASLIFVSHSNIN